MFDKKLLAAGWGQLSKINEKKTVIDLLWFHMNLIRSGWD